MNINTENIEELILLYIDNELDPDTAIEMLKFIDLNPAYKEMLADYQAVVLEADHTIIYENKDNLKQKIDLINPKSTKVISFISWKQIAGVAAILFMVINIGFLINNQYLELSNPQIQNTALQTEVINKMGEHTVTNIQEDTLTVAKVINHTGINKKALIRKAIKDQKGAPNLQMNLRKSLAIQEMQKSENYVSIEAPFEVTRPYATLLKKELPSINIKESKSLLLASSLREKAPEGIVGDIMKLSAKCIEVTQNEDLYLVIDTKNPKIIKLN